MVKRIYKTMQGREIDMDALLAKNETAPAVGNVRMNARGDELGPGGKIARRREDIVAEYYEDNPNATPSYTAPVAPAPVAEVKPAPKAEVKSSKVTESKGTDE
jgi:hypothetical protein